MTVLELFCLIFHLSYGLEGTASAVLSLWWLTPARRQRQLMIEDLLPLPRLNVIVS